MRDWTELDRGQPKRRIIESVLENWQNLLEDKNRVEEDYQRFLIEHAGLFFGNPSSSILVISKFEFGNDHKADFIVPRDDGSYGFVYDIIELESPHDKAFTKAGIPSQSLAGALKQIQDWKRWLANHRLEKQELLPSSPLALNGDERFNYSIYIDRRENIILHDQHRIDFEKSHNINLRSYDRLTEHLKKYLFFDTTLLCSAEEEKLELDVLNELVNPFFKAISFKEWKDFCKKPGLETSHMYALNFTRIIESRKYNRLLDIFDGSD